MPTYPSYRGVFSAKKKFLIRTKIWRKIQNQKWPTPYEAKFERAISQPQVTSPRHSYGLIYLPGSSLGRHEKFRKKSKIHRDIDIFRKKKCTFQVQFWPFAASSNFKILLPSSSPGMGLSSQERIFLGSAMVAEKKFQSFLLIRPKMAMVPWSFFRNVPTFCHTHVSFWIWTSPPPPLPSRNLGSRISKFQDASTGQNWT